MRKFLLFAALSSLGIAQPVLGRGVSPYLPLKLAPDIERKIERVLILAGKPVMRRPIPAAVVFDALPNACAVDSVLCEQVRDYLQRYQRDVGVSLLQVQAIATTGDSDRIIPNAHGRDAGSAWQVAGAAHYQPGDHFLLGLGGIAYTGRATPTGSVFSMGFDFAQLDIGFRDHWFSPLTDSSMLISTEAATLPSITLSNYQPISFLGINYEVFLAELSPQEGIRYFDTVTAGKPKLAGVHLGIEPVAGYAFALNRLMQYGGGARNGAGFSDLKEAFLTNKNQPDVAGVSQEFGNQVASITSSMVFPGKVPFVARMEYAGEDNSYDGNKRLGDTSLSLGLDFPQLGDRYDLSYEISEWQNVWYTHGTYPKGLTHHDRVLGHWFGDQRVFGDKKAGRSQTLQLGLQTNAGNYWRATYRNLAFSKSLGFEITPPISYQQLHELGAQYHTNWRGHAVGAELTVGRDVFGDSFASLTASFDLAKSVARSNGPTDRAAIAESDADVDFFVDLGLNYSSVYERLSFLYPNRETSYAPDLHVGAGARRPVSEHGDLGVRLEFDGIDGRGMLSIRALDYRYRFGRHLAASGFFGVGRYHFKTSTLGYYWGVGFQWRDVLPSWDLGIDLRHYDKLSRNRIIEGDPPLTEERPRIHFDVKSYALYLSRKY